MEKQTATESKVKTLLASRTTADLVELWEMTEKTDGKDIYTIRGWIMDELEYRDTEKFNRFVDGEPISIFLEQ